MAVKIVCYTVMRAVRRVAVYRPRPIVAAAIVARRALPLVKPVVVCVTLALPALVPGATIPDLYAPPAAQPAPVAPEARIERAARSPRAEAEVAQVDHGRIVNVPEPGTLALMAAALALLGAVRFFLYAATRRR
jgi:hypothetical protein